MSTTDLQNLFANLKPKSRETSVPLSPAPNPMDNQTPGSAPSPFPFPTSGQNRALSPNTAQIPKGPGGNFGQSESLLRLLNYPSSSAPRQVNRSASAQGEARNDQDKPQQGSNVTASDLLARFRDPSAKSATQPNPFKTDDRGGGENGFVNGTPVSTDLSSQDALQRLLSKAHTSSAAGGRVSSAEHHQADPELDSFHRQARDNNVSRSVADLTNTSTTKKSGSLSPSLETNVNQADTDFGNPGVETKPAATKPIFTYTNPFEALSASRVSTSKPNTPVPQPILSDTDRLPSLPSQSPSVAKVTQTPSGQAPQRRILTPKLSASKLRAGAVQASEPHKTAGSSSDPVSGDIEKSTPTAEVNVTNMPAVSNGLDTNGDREQVATSISASKDVAPKAGTDEWEDAEDSPSKDDTSRVVPVYNFPIKPFVSITLNLAVKSQVGIREDSVMEISRLKKEFDQVDRSLAAATTKYISYALPKHGGLRIIRQDDGTDRQVFKNSHDRVFSVSFCTTSTNAPPSENQAVLGTGVSGAVYYATVCKEGNDLFEKNDLDLESLIFPPIPPTDENTAGGVLKTRAKRSSRHPEYFAIGRGKAIHLIWPATAMSPKYGISNSTRKVDVEKFYQERTLQISTGKAGKDFVFSEDDSLIVSLDKTGRLRFWDIRKLTDETNATATRVSPVSVDMPLLSLSTASPAEKSWPTSVLFVDKARAYAKGGALRYVLVGLRQNHTLQLWDIALSKAVQELNFPHENETDGICSVAYHANSGIIVVGHPTRNSLFFIHLSAPRYTLSSSLSQAVYVQRIASKDPDIRKPDSTACMTGIRELSFADKGQLRSVELLPVHKTDDPTKTSDEKTPLFELYIVHSKGVTCLGISKEDLGWDADSKVIKPIDADRDGLVDLKELKLGSVIEEVVPIKENVEEPPVVAKTAKKKAKKTAQSGGEKEEVLQSEAVEPTAVNQAHSLPEPKASQLVLANGEATKDVKKSKKKSPATAEPVDSSKTATNDAPSAPNVTQVPAPTVLQELRQESPDRGAAATGMDSATSATATGSNMQAASKAESVTVGISGDWLDKEMKKVERGVATEFQKELGILYENLQNQRVIQDSSAVARQEAVLRLVSTTLTNNVEKSLARIITSQVQQSVIPAVTQAAVQAITTQLVDTTAKTLHQVMPHEIGSQLPSALSAALQHPQMVRSVSEVVSGKVAKQTESLLTELLDKSIMPTFKELAITVAEKAAANVESRIRGDIQRHDADRKADLSRMEKLSSVVQGMAETLQSMSSTQVTFQNQILRDRRQIALMGDGSPALSSRQVSTARMSPLPAPIARPMKTKTKEEIELEEITALMDDGNYEEGSIKWLQSTQPVELFDNLFVQYTPEYLSTDVSPLVAFSIAVTVGSSLTTNTARRLEWINAAFESVDVRDPEIADLAQHAPALLSSLIQRLESLYMTTAEQNHLDPILKMIPPSAKLAKDMRTALQSLSEHF